MQSLLTKVPEYLGSSCAPEQFPWSHLGYQKVQQIRSEMQIEGYSPNTINQALCALKGVANAAFNLEQISAETLMRIRSVKAVKGSVQSRSRSLTKREARRVIKILKKERTLRSKRDLALFMLGIGGGLRCAELVALRVPDVNLSDGCITVVKGKGNVHREVFVAEETTTALGAWINSLESPMGTVFRPITKNDKILESGLTTNGVRDIVSKLANTAGIEQFGPHDMRRTFVTQLLASKVDLHTVSKLAGHANINTTSRYDKRGDAMLRRASRELSF